MRLNSARTLLAAGVAAVSIGFTQPAASLAAAKTAAVPSRSSAELPTFEQVQDAFDAGRYRDVLKDLSRIINSREWRQNQFNRYELLMLKARTHLQMKEGSLAAASFGLAAKETADPKKKADAAAYQLLLQRSNGVRFVPRPAPGDRSGGSKAPPPEPIDLVNPDSRKQALATFYQEEKTAADPRIEAAENGDSVQAVLDVGPVLSRLRTLDFAVNGSDDATRQTADTIANHGRDLLSRMTDKMGIRVDVISGKVLAWDKYRMRGTDVWRRHGWEGTEENELKKMIEKTSKILMAAKIMQDTLLADKGFFDRVTVEAKRIHDKADKTLKTNLSEVAYKPPKNTD